MDENQLIGATLDRVYRLAMLAAGSPRGAARLTRRAYAAPHTDAPRTDAPAGRLYTYTDAPAPRTDAPPGRLDTPGHSAGYREEAALARSLLSARPLLWPWRPDPATQSGLTTAELVILRATLAAAAPAARVALGAPHLAGLTLDEGLAPRPLAPDAPWPRRAGDRHALLALLARAWGLLPAAAAYADVYEQALLLAGALPPEQASAMRALLLAATPAAELSRAIREGLRRAEAHIAAALPALFAGETPAELRAELRAALVTPAPLARPAPSPIARRRLALVAAVAALALAVIALPRPAPGQQTAADLAAQLALPPTALVRAAIGRLEQPAGAGVLYERFAAAAPGSAWTFERWQDLASPHRFRVEVRDDEDRLRFALASDGQGMIQQRAAAPGEDAPTGADLELDPDALATLLPLLRQRPDGLLRPATLSGSYTLEHFYLSQALGAPLSDLGATVVAGRPARLVAFASATPTPPNPDAALAPPAGQPSQVLLAIDAATYALLEARVLPAATDATGEVAVPWRAEAYELLDAAPASTFTLPPLPAARAASPRGV